MKLILNKKDLLEALEGTNDNDAVVIEVHDNVLTEDLYSFTVDIISGVELEDGSKINEIRLSAVGYQTADETCKQIVETYNNKKQRHGH